MIEDCIKETSDGVELRVYATPRANKTEIVDLMQDKCRIRVKAPPVEGKANSVLIKFLAKVFGVSKSKVSLVKGHKSKTKCFCLHGLKLSEAVQKLKKLFNRE